MARIVPLSIGISYCLPVLLSVIVSVLGLIFSSLNLPVQAKFPMPRLVKIWIKAKTLGILDQPLVGRGIDLYQTVMISGIDRISSDVQIQGTSRKMRAVDGQSRAARMWRAPAELSLIAR